MFDAKAIVVLLQLTAVSVLAIPWAWREYWPEIGNSAALMFTLCGFIAGGCATAAYILVRYRHELTTPREAAE